MSALRSVTSTSSPVTENSFVYQNGQSNTPHSSNLDELRSSATLTAATHPVATLTAATHPAATHPVATHPVATHPAATLTAATLTESKETNRLDPRKNTVDKNGVLRFDFLFSNWLLMWFIIYYFTPLKSSSSISQFIRKYMNPSLGFYVALFENALTFIWFIYNRTDTWTLFKFVSMVSLLKILPLYLIQPYKIQWIRDSMVLFSVFIAYNVFLALNDTNIYEIYERTVTSIQQKKNQTPFFALLNQWFHI